MQLWCHPRRPSGWQSVHTFLPTSSFGHGKIKEFSSHKIMETQIHMYHLSSVDMLLGGNGARYYAKYEVF